MIEPENLNTGWYVGYNDHRQGTERGPYGSKLDALIACFPEIEIREESILKFEPLKTETKQERAPETTDVGIPRINNFKDSKIFPCDIIPKKRLD